MPETFSLTNDYKINRCYDFINELYWEKVYLFVGDHTVHSNVEVQTANNNLYSLYYDVFNKMIMGKQIYSNSACLGIKNIPYEAGLVYTQYDDQIDLSNELYYCIVNAGSFSHVFKCLHNNHGANSTVAPNFMHIEGANTIIYQTSDGYIWKYMYTVDDQTVAQFGTSSFFPLVTNTDVQEAAISGTINIIDVVTGGKLYNNYLSGVLLNSDIRIEPDVYQISNSIISTVNGYYTDCIMYLTEGDGVGQYRNIYSYYSNTSGNYVELETDFTISPTNGTKYDITPRVRVYGESDEECVARAIVNSVASNSVAYIEVLNPGRNQFIVSANVIANAAVGVASGNRAVVRPILPPSGGHGANAASELNASHVLLSLTLANSESNTILTTNFFQQIGLIKNPVFANVNLTLADATRVFNLNEIAQLVYPTELSNTAVVTTTSSIITDVNASFTTQFTNGSSIIISNGTIYQTGTVLEVIDNNNIDIGSNGYFDATDAVVYSSIIIENLDVISVTDATNIAISNTIGHLVSGSVLIGQNSGAYAVVTNISRNNVEKDFKTFIQLYKYTIVPIHGNFIAGETIVQGDSTALLHSVVDTTMYLSGLNGEFSNTGPSIYGITSGAEAQLSAAFMPELTKGRGTIEYVDNIEPVTRTTDQTETFKICLTL